MDTEPAELYLDLLKKCLTRSIFSDGGLSPGAAAYTEQFDPQLRAEGRDWPQEAETMIGMKRLDNLHHCIKTVVRDGIEGDLAETGVWRGGATIFMRGALAAYGDRARAVWVADSFRGLPKPDPKRYPADEGDELWTIEQLAIPLEEVKANFARYGLLDDRVRFLEGFFRDTLPTAPIEVLAVLRLDGDLYESTMEALQALYDRVSPGGFVIVDDYSLETCKAAVDDFRARREIVTPLERIDWTGTLWRRDFADDVRPDRLTGA